MGRWNEVLFVPGLVSVRSGSLASWNWVGALVPSLCHW